MGGRRSLVAATTLVVAAAVLGACSDGEEDTSPPTVTATPSDEAPAPSATRPTSPSPSREQPPGPPRVVDTVARNLSVPWGIDFLPDGTAIVTERDTRRVLAIKGGRVRQVGVIESAAPQGEAGLLGVAVSPGFARDRTIFLYVTTAEDNRIVRTTYRNGRLGTPEVILDGIPNGFIHDGGRLQFGPDGHLYASTGETGIPELAPNPDSLGGKILRITTDGDPAPGNPDPSSPVWTLGHRNVQGLAFDDDDNLWASEFGASTFDELNLIRKGGNYGWPTFEGRGDDPDLVNPQVVWNTSEASPSGLAYVDGQLWLGALQGQRLWRIDVADGRAARPTDFFVGRYGRLRTVVVAPDGNLWVSTSNRDGRATPGPEDDQILVVDPG
ncbi:PQQ-dependent sugar dehydrogenase [Nocardioides sp.]|uniref:PQQ-dependent sugar dehydrogenase n=1 Tax=Nocardioides sp. TaxID=35761 RepID=UPI002D7E59C2|nr:PQQ-dependent sugar dehydrogenase [Nocardioides sp.]HET8959397.1 PQQ-dependent sugar dehydrogenase [Nocardioides sp.]